MMKKIVVVITFLLLSVIPVWYLLHGIIAGGENFLYINPGYLNYLTSWEDKFNFGQISANQSNLILFNYGWKLLSLVPFIHPSVIFIILSFFISSLTFYLLSSKIFDIKNPFIYLPSSILYTYNTFRLMGPINERQNLLFMSLPLFLLLYWQLCRTLDWIYVFLLILLSLMSSSMAGNLPVFMIPYLMILVMFIYFFVQSLKTNKKILYGFLLKNFILAFFIIGINSFWLIPLYKQLFLQTQNVMIGSAYFTVTASGYFFDHFRFIGSWAWRSGSMGVPYYPFYTYYDEPLLLISTIGVTLLSFLGIFFIKKMGSEKRPLLSFVAFLIPLSFLLLAGNKGPLGFVFDYLYKHSIVFSIYREPFAKFTPVFVFSTAIFLVLSVWFIYKYIKKPINYIFLFTISVLVVFNALPFFNGEAIPVKKWLGGSSGNLIKIPDYWSDAKSFVEQDLSDRRLALYPPFPYGGSHIWPTGVGTVGNMADFLFRNRITRSWDTDQSVSGTLIKKIFTDRDPSTFARTLGLYNSEYILQMNDYDWRPSLSLSPIESNKFLTSAGLTVYKSFGILDKEIIDSVRDDEPKSVGEKLNQVIGLPALNLYSINPTYYFPHMYIADSIIVSDNDPLSITSEIKKIDIKIKPAIVFSKQNSDKETKDFCSNNCINESTILEYRKIDPTKYIGIIHNPKKSIPLVFTESFDPSWQLSVSCSSRHVLSESNIDGYKVFDGNASDQADKKDLELYISKGWVSDITPETKTYSLYSIKDNKETLLGKVPYSIAFISKINKGTIQNDNLSLIERGMKVVPEKSHFLVNGLANMWILDNEHSCPEGKDINILINYKLQKTQDNLFLIAIMFLAFSIFSLVFLLIKRLRSNK